MSWLRIDDGEALDARVGALTDPEYRGRHALLQLCAREHRDDGLFHPKDIVHAAYTTPKGPRALTRKGLARLQELGMVRARGDYTDEDIAELGIDWPEGDERLRIHRWEKYNPPRDSTKTVRQERWRKRKRGENVDGDVDASRDAHVDASTNGSVDGVSVDAGDGPSRAGTRARSPSRPVPVKEKPQAVALHVGDPGPDRTALDDFIEEITPDLREMPA